MYHLFFVQSKSTKSIHYTYPILKKPIILWVSLFFLLISIDSKSQINTRFQQIAQHVTIIRDNYGIPHVYGKTDANAVFGLMYAQCEEDFQRVEMNYITMLGRTAEILGKDAIYEDLLVKITIDTAAAIKDYQRAPAWMKSLLQSWADGINYYLLKHPTVQPALLRHFEPWWPLTYTDGSISAIQTGGLTANDLKAFYAQKDIVSQLENHPGNEEQLIGSNGFAIAPSKSTTGKPLFFINPHVTFYFRPEVQMTSEEGLNSYGAVTWGQFFVYQGFNEHCGWMHTSSEADAADLYAEKVTQKDGKMFYEYDNKKLPVQSKTLKIYYSTKEGIQSQQFTVYSTHHGPIMGSKNGKWLSLKTQNRSLDGLIQSWTRIKSKNLADFKKSLDYRANLSNNTVYADADGNIAYWHGNYMPKRNPAYNWNLPVDGSTSATEWIGMHTIDELVNVINPASGWIQNTNNTPFSVSGISSPKKEKYATYFAPDAENFRGLNAVRLLSAKKIFSESDLIHAASDMHLTAFDTSLPYLFAAFENIKTTNLPLYNQVKDAIEVLKLWDKNTGTSSVATNVAIHWAERLNIVLRAEDPEILKNFTVKYGKILRTIAPTLMVQPLADVLEKLKKDFGRWDIPWGEINRMQRISNTIIQQQDDEKPSLASGRASSMWGALPSFNSKYLPNTKKRYGFGGNSFVCLVEFGKTISAKSILAGGQSGNIHSPHFFDQAEMYLDSKFKVVWFYPNDVKKHAEKTYHPGEEIFLRAMK